MKKKSQIKKPILEEIEDHSLILEEISHLSKDTVTKELYKRQHLAEIAIALSFINMVLVLMLLLR